MSTVIQIENLSKYYRLGLIGGGTLREDVNRWIAKLQGKPDPLLKIGETDHGNRKDGQIWALRDINLEVKEGEILGIIGRNGAGKSTLLKILSRITAPTEGRIKIKGRVGSLLEVGTGFHPELTGRENIYLNGTILGMSKAEVTRKLDEIVEFAEMAQFIDTPVKRYSSGMTVRLAFAVAAHLEPEILVIDEVLAVGDAAFQKKCLGKMGEVASHGRTVLFVSHNMATISRLCDRSVMLSTGKVIQDGPTPQVIVHYLTSSSRTGGEINWRAGFANKGVELFKFTATRIRNHLGQITDQLQSTTPFKIEIDYEARRQIANARVGFLITTVEGITLFESYDTDANLELKDRAVGAFTMSCSIPGQLLSPGRYLLSLNAGIPNILNLAFAENVLTFNVTDTGSPGSELISRRRGIIRPRLDWEIINHTLAA